MCRADSSRLASCINRPLRPIPANRSKSVFVLSADISAVVPTNRRHSHNRGFQTVENKAEFFRLSNCRKKGEMRATLASEVLDWAEGLVAELKAIEQWDVAYWRNPSPEAYETLAFVARGKRRCEILSQLLSINSPTAQQKKKEPLTVKKLCPAQERKTGVTHGLSWK